MVISVVGNWVNGFSGIPQFDFFYYISYNAFNTVAPQAVHQCYD